VSLEKTGDWSRKKRKSRRKFFVMIWDLTSIKVACGERKYMGTKSLGGVIIEAVRGAKAVFHHQSYGIGLVLNQNRNLFRRVATSRN